MVSKDNLGAGSKSDVPETFILPSDAPQGETRDFLSGMEDEASKEFELFAPAQQASHTSINGALQPVEHLGSGGMGAVFLMETMDKQALRDQAEAFARQLTPNLPEDHPERRALEETIRANIDEVLAETRFVVAKVATVIREADITSGTRTYAQGLAWREAKRQLERQAAMPHAPRILGGQLNRYPVYFLQSFHRGFDLEKLMAEMPEAPGAAGLQAKLALLAQAARNVAQIAEAGLVHRDIKPSNFLLDEEGDLKTLDFGLARRVSNESMAMTQEGQGVGTVQYVAPEVISGRTNVTAKADVFSLGVMAVEQLTGRSPYRGATVKETAVKRSLLKPGEKPEPVIFDHLESADPAERRFILEALVPVLTRMIDPDPLKRPEPMEIAEFFHSHSYLAGRVSFEEFIDPSSRKGALHLPRASAEERPDGPTRRYATPGEMVAALGKGAAERSLQYDFLEQFRSEAEKKSAQTVFSRIAHSRGLITGVVGAAVLAGSAMAYMTRSASRPEKQAVTRPDDTAGTAAPVAKEERKPAAPEIIDGGGGAAMRLENGRPKDIRLFAENPVMLGKDLIPCYAMDTKGEAPVGAVFFCTPEDLMKLMKIDDPSRLDDKQRNGQIGQYMQSFDGSSKLVLIGGTVMMVEHEGRRFVYSDYPEVLESRAAGLAETESGTIKEIFAEVAKSGYALEDIPATLAAEGEPKAYWPENVRERSGIEIQNMALQFFQHKLRENGAGRDAQ